MAHSRNRGRKKPSLRSLSQQWPTPAEASAVVDALHVEQPPIVLAILGAALLEYDLEKALRPRFQRRDDDTWEAITADRGMLGTLSSKIDAAYALGIVDDIARDALHSVRHIRNAFAHSKRLIDFEHPLVGKELRGLTLPEHPRGEFQTLLAEIKFGKSRNENETEPLANQAGFILLCLHLSNLLVRRETKRQGSQIRYWKKKATALANPKFSINYSIMNSLSTPLVLQLSDPQALQAGFITSTWIHRIGHPTSAADSKCPPELLEAPSKGRRTKGK